ncbi:MAG: hypothetical protein KC443_00490, partial [Anaerolineales bacterium]|nr:hypothetical protein [Anaerolineales bacterium]
MSKRLFVLLVIMVLTVLPFCWLYAAAAPEATTRYVAPGGVDGANDCVNPANPCGSVVHAVQQTDTGDTVLLAAGWYTETDTIRVFRDMTIQGAGLDQTIVSVEANPDIWQVVQVYGEVTAVVSRLTLRNAERNGVQNLGDLTLTHVNILENRGVLGGGGIYNDGVITITDSIIGNNHSSDTAAGMLNFGEATIQRALFVGNKAAPFSYGGGLHNQGTAQLENVTFALNEAGAATAVSNIGQLTLTNVTIAQNIGIQPGATEAAAVINDGTLQAVNTLIADNGPGRQCDSNTNATITSLGFNLDSYNGCNFDQPSDLQFANAQLETFTAVTGTPNWISPISFAIGSPA